MKSRFLVNIRNMHAWLIASLISNIICPCPLPSLPARLAPILTDTNFHLTHQTLRKTHTHHFMTLWPDQDPALSLASSLWILTVLHFKLNIPLVSLQHGFFYTVTNCAEYTFFPGSQS